MSHRLEKQPSLRDIETLSPTVPYLANTHKATRLPTKENHELADRSALTNGGEIASGVEELNDPSEDQVSLSVPSAIPVSYKVIAFSMIIFFNTSSSFSESTLSPLKGIFRAELGVTSKSFFPA